MGEAQTRRIALLAGVLVSLVVVPAHAEWARFALVVGHNDSDDSDLAPLRYADDDAIKHAQLLRVMTRKTILLASVDTESRRTFADERPEAPTRGNVQRALGELHAEMAAAKARGDQPVLYFVYSGHGNYDQEGRGYVHLADGRFTTRDMYYEVLGPSARDGGHHVILMVDACNAALLVNSRGSDRRRVQTASQRLEDYPNVGVILSSSSVGEVHEWGRYLSGIFSHEMRSALLGPADLNDDGAITFGELAAFVANANAEVRNETYRLKPYIRPPLSAPNLPLVEGLAKAFGARLRIAASVSGKAHLLNDELLRYADFHKSAGHAFWLGLPGDDGWTLVHDNKEYIIPAGARGDLDLAALETRGETLLSARGTDQYFESRLFAQAHSPARASDWLQRSYRETLVVERFVEVPWYENTGAWALLGSGLASLGGAVGLHVAAIGAADDAAAAQWFSDRYVALEEARQMRDASIALYSIGGAMAIGGALWFAFDRRYETRRYEPPLRVQVTPTGVQFTTDF